MRMLWAKDDPEVCLTHGDLFETAYPKNYLSHIEDSRKGLLTQDEIDQTVGNIFEHPSLDIRSIFLDFRLSGLLPPENAVSIKPFLEERQNDIQLLDSKIKDTISAIAQLSRELTQASARMVQRVSQVRLCEYLLSPLEHLHQDILEQIFIACLATRDSPGPKPNRAPLLVAAVCHRWRTIALSMPFLWNELHISHDVHVELAKVWVSRCYRPSLTLFGNNDIPSSKLKELLSDLQGPSLCPRKIDVMSSWFRGTSGDLVKDFFLDQHALEELVLRDPDGAIPSLPTTSTSLRRIYTHIIPESWHHSPPPQQLTVLWLTSKIHRNTFLVFLATCPNIESLYLEIDEDGLRLDPEPQIQKDITLHQLTYLGLWDGSETVELPQDFLQGGHFPSLRVLEYRVGKQAQSAKLWRGFIHTQTPLRRLTLQFDNALPSLESIIYILEEATSVVELSISTKAHHMPNVLEALTPMVFPSLQRLYLDVSFDKLIEWLPLEPQLTALGQAWSTSHPSDTNSTRSPTQLVVQHRYQNSILVKDRNQKWETLKVKQMFQSACPDLRVRILSILATDWFWQVPVSFGMFPLPFNSARAHEVLEDDESWSEKPYDVYQVM
ncbi:hypothetical protein BDN72DRAFT_958516 [Pluteus cervinus]|uniref:Uncharacterized protein n=1 Tax=Pluteus cervinus TaxID=181527 RepID=A0ACD3AYL2_9AGAR|nr:hypothetical protein BDN72DRAFT_958516 [Pluteus cervinus]